MYKLSNFSSWFNESVFESSEKKYTFRLLKTNSVLSKEAIDEIKAVVFEAHEDAKRRLRNLSGISLDPLQEPSGFDPAQGYPECLEFQTLKGYFGEILAGIVAINYSHFGEDGWEMPVSLFRFHSLAFDQIERLRQDAIIKVKKTIGRTGDDNLAFVRAENGDISKTLICEAKCTADHDSDLINDAHKKISEANLIPVSIPYLIEVLLDYDDTASQEWVDALRKLWLSPKGSLERYDLISYACGRAPARTSQKSWIKDDQPHPEYTGGRSLEAVEILLSKVDQLILEVYGKRESQNEQA
jgi:hypothetical protein